MRLFSPARNPEAMIAALAGFCLIAFSAPAVGLSPDSITYTSAARNLLATGHPLEFDGQWLVDFPLGYPAFLSLILFITRIDPFHFGLILNGLLFGILVFVCIREMKKNGFPLWLRCLYGLSLLFSVALLEVYGMLWSETLFILCVALFFVTCDWYGRTHGNRALWAMAGVTALACITRYAGVTMLSMGLLLLLTDRTLVRWKRALHILLYGSIGCSLLLINLILNRINEGFLAGDRLINQTPVPEHLQRFGTAIFHWFPILSKGEYPVLSLIFTSLLVGGSILGVLYLWIRERSQYSWAALGLLFTAIYSVFILAMAVLTAFQPLDSRLLSPIWFPALGAAAGGWMVLRNRFSGIRWARIMVGVVAIVMALFISYPGLIREVHYLSRPELVYQDHLRYDFRAFDHSPTLRFVNTHPALFRSDKEVYSNAGEVLYVLIDLPSDYLPRLNKPEELETFRSDTAYLIWLNDIHVSPDAYLNDLRSASPLVPLYSFPDGAIYSTK
jgi:hypothetical protein